VIAAWSFCAGFPSVQREAREAQHLPLPPTNAFRLYPINLRSKWSAIDLIAILVAGIGL
jgi:hypothetical protein